MPPASGPQEGPQSTRVPCDDCDARIGQPCQVWKKAGGKRLYRERTAAKQHKSRVDAARNAGHQPPPGRPR